MKRFLGYMLAAASLVSMAAPAIAQQDMGRADNGAKTRLRTGTNGNLYVYQNPLPVTESGVPFATYRIASLATTNGALIATGPHRIYSGVLTNLSASTRYVKFYNRSNAPIVGTTVPVITIAIPAGQTVGLSTFAGSFGFYVPLGLGIAITGAYADTDTTAVGVNDVIVHVNYI